MITLDKKRSKACEDLIAQIKALQWGLIVLDEVLLSFADKFWQVRPRASHDSTLVQHNPLRVSIPCAVNALVSETNSSQS
eukprot:2791432-Rhodomonas_salina.1